MHMLLDNFSDVMDERPSPDAKLDPIVIKTREDYPIAVNPYQIPQKKVAAFKEEIWMTE